VYKIFFFFLFDLFLFYLFILFYFLGSIIRCIRRLDELLKQMEEACQVIGNMALKDRFAQASKLIQRGIIFAASLYLNNE